MKSQDKYREQAIQLLDRLKKFEDVLTDEEEIKMVRTELVLASLDGKLEVYKENK